MSSGTVETKWGARPRCEEWYEVTDGVTFLCDHQRYHGRWNGAGRPIAPLHSVSLGDSHDAHDGMLTWTTPLRKVGLEALAWAPQHQEGTFEIASWRSAHWHVIDDIVICVEHLAGAVKCGLCVRGTQVVDRPPPSFEED